MRRAAAAALAVAAAAVLEALALARVGLAVPAVAALQGAAAAAFALAVPKALAAHVAVEGLASPAAAVCAMLLLLLLLLMIRSLPDCSNLTQTVHPLIQGAGTVAVAFFFAYYNVDALHCSKVVLRV